MPEGLGVLAVCIKHTPSRVIRNARQYRYAVPALHKLLYKVIDPEVFGPEVLTDDQDFHAPITLVFLPHHAVHVVGVAVDDAQHLV